MPLSKQQISPLSVITKLIVRRTEAVNEDLYQNEKDAQILFLPAEALRHTNGSTSCELKLIFALQLLCWTYDYLDINNKLRDHALGTTLTPEDQQRIKEELECCDSTKSELTRYLRALTQRVHTPSRKDKSNRAVKLKDLHITIETIYQPLVIVRETLRTKDVGTVLAKEFSQLAVVYGLALRLCHVGIDNDAKVQSKDKDNAQLPTFYKEMKKFIHLHNDDKATQINYTISIPECTQELTFQITSNGVKSIEGTSDINNLTARIELSNYHFESYSNLTRQEEYADPVENLTSMPGMATVDAEATQPEEVQTPVGQSRLPSIAESPRGIRTPSDDKEEKAGRSELVLTEDMMLHSKPRYIQSKKHQITTSPLAQGYTSTSSNPVEQNNLEPEQAPGYNKQETTSQDKEDSHNQVTITQQGASSSITTDSNTSTSNDAIVKHTMQDDQSGAYVTEHAKGHAVQGDQSATQSTSNPERNDKSELEGKHSADKDTKLPLLNNSSKTGNAFLILFSYLTLTLSPAILVIELICRSKELLAKSVSRFASCLLHASSLKLKVGLYQSKSAVRSNNVTQTKPSARPPQDLSSQSINRPEESTSYGRN